MLRTALLLGAASAMPGSLMLEEEMAAPPPPPPRVVRPAPEDERERRDREKRERDDLTRRALEHRQNDPKWRAAEAKRARKAARRAELEERERQRKADKESHRIAMTTPVPILCLDCGARREQMPTSAISINTFGGWVGIVDSISLHPCACGSKRARFDR